MDSIGISTDFRDFYRSEYRAFEGLYRRKDSSGLIDIVKTESNILELKEALLGLCQILSYSVTEVAQKSKKRLKATNAEESDYKVLQSVMSQTQKVLLGFYNGMDYSRQEISEMLVGHQEKIKSITGKRIAKPRDAVIPNDYLKLLDYVSDRFEKPDIVIGVSSGGIEPALLVSSLMSINDIDVIRYSGQKGSGDYSGWSKDKEAKIPVPARTKISNASSVMIIDDRRGTGNTFRKISKSLKSYGPKEFDLIALDANSEYKPITWSFSKKLIGYSFYDTSKKKA